MWTRTFLIVVGLICFGLVSTQASAKPTTFGARLTIHTQPSNAGKGVACNVNTSHPDCTWVLMQAYQCEFGSCLNGHLAPKDGTIAKISLIACYKGDFDLQIVSVIPAKDLSKSKAKLVASGPHIDYMGDPKHCNGNTYEIETFKVSVPVSKGDYLAVATTSLGFARCSGGGANILLFKPPLSSGPARKANGSDGCFMLLEATYSD